MKNYMFGDKKNKIKDSERSLISETVSIEGTINSSGAIDVAGLVKGPVISKELIVRDTGSITGTIEADDVEIHGHLDGKVSAQNIVIGATGTVKGDIEFDSSMPDGTPRKLLDTSRIKNLGWKKKIGLEEGIKMTIKNYPE